MCSTSCGTRPLLSIIMTAIALVFGVHMVLAIGGADMPVVISLYNALTGLAVGFEGFVLQNPAMMIAGIVVGSAGSAPRAAASDSVACLLLFSSHATLQVAVS